MRNWVTPADYNEVFVESTSAGELRAQRVWRFIGVMWLTWVFFALFLNFRDYEIAAQICGWVAVLQLIVNLARHKQSSIQTLLNLNLGASAIGLFTVSISDPAMYGVMLFYPVSILVASQLLGVRAAFQWFLVNLVAFVSFFIVVHGVERALHTAKFDELVLLMGVAACVYFCCQQGEEYYRKRTEKLIHLSEDLQVKSDSLELLATTDALTGLLNRFQFQNQLRDTVEKSKSDLLQSALYLIDMNGFKNINDTMGHAVGDDVLVMIAKRLTDEFGEQFDIARLGGDEFCLIAQGIVGFEEAESIAKRVSHVMTQRYSIENTEFLLGASIGYALFPDHAQTDKDLLAFADTAMFHAKEHGRDFSKYETEMTDRLVEYRTVQDKLSRALEQDEFFLAYQPQFDLKSNVLIGAEALLRWRSDGEIIPPYRFIHLLERSREILPVSKWIIRQACRQLSIWNLEGYSAQLSVNVSAVQFNDPDFFQSIIEPICEFGVDPRQLDFEITEGLLISDISLAVAKLNQIKNLGCTISIDDFGTGYSSLAYLRQLPIDRIKIDRAFVKDYPETDDGLIASSIIVLAKTLGLKALAEGVETEAQLQFLKDHDCDEYQGFIASKPIAPQDVLAFLKNEDKSVETFRPSMMAETLSLGASTN
jgi:diguanylate cyclase (GGDEF)-like protein